jgi:hypothetical protein
MTRRLFVTSLFLILFAGPAWPRLKPEDQQYFDNQFHGVLEQIQALSKQVQTLNARLADAEKNQAQFQEALARQQRTLQDLEQLVSSLRVSSEESLIALKTNLSQMRAETQKSLSVLSGRPTETTAVGASGTASLPPATVQGYVTVVEGAEVVIDQGSAKGLRVGARLTLYKANDPTTRAGMLEVTAIVDAGNSRAKIVSINAGVRPEFGDIVRLE